MLAVLRSLLPTGATLAGPTAAGPYAALPTTSSAASLLPASAPAFPPPPTLPFLVLGAAVLLPWNLILSALPFFASLLGPAAPLQSSALPSTLSFLATGTNFLALSYITFSSARKGSGSSSTGGQALVRSIRRSLLALLLAFGAVELLIVLLPAAGEGGVGTVGLLACWVACMMLAGSYLQASVVSYSSLFGPSAMGAVMTGQGAIAVLVSLVQVLSSVVASHSSSAGGGADSKSDLQWPTFGFVAAGAAFQLYTLFALDQISTHPTHALALVTAPAAAIESSTPSAGDSSTDLTSNPSSPVLDLFRRNALANGSIALAFVVTLSVFPAVTAAVTPVGLGAWWREPAIWVPLGFLCFNVGDLVGRALPARVTLRSQSTLALFALARLAFIPFFLGCNTPARALLSLTTTASSPPFSDGTFLLGLFLLGGSNGFVSATGMIVASTPALNPRLAEGEQELAGTIAVFCLVGGLVLGSASSFGVVGYMGKH